MNISRHLSAEVQPEGANATIICCAPIGCYAFISAGAVARGDGLDYALMLGVSVVQKGGMSRHAHSLQTPDKIDL